MGLTLILQRNPSFSQSTQLDARNLFGTFKKDGYIILILRQLRYHEPVVLKLLVTLDDTWLLHEDLQRGMKK